MCYYPTTFKCVYWYQWETSLQLQGRACTTMSAEMWRVGEEENKWQEKQEEERDKCVLRWWECGRLYWCHERINQ